LPGSPDTGWLVATVTRASPRPPHCSVSAWPPSTVRCNGPGDSSGRRWVTEGPRAGMTLCRTGYPLFHRNARPQLWRGRPACLRKSSTGLSTGRYPDQAQGWRDRSKLSCWPWVICARAGQPRPCLDRALIVPRTCRSRDDRTLPDHTLPDHTLPDHTPRSRRCARGGRPHERAIALHPGGAGGRAR